MSLPLDPALHKAVLMGIDRAPLDAEFGLPARHADDLIALLKNGRREAALWHAIAVTDICGRAGYVPVIVPEVAAAATDERTCATAAEQVLRLLLRGIHPELLESWLQLASLHGTRVPHDCLPDLLDAGLKKRGVREALIPLLDKRGQWLVAQHPEWAQAYGVAEDVQAQWNTGDSAERVRALQAMRRDDPTATLVALQADWSSVPPAERATLLRCLSVGLNMQDEAFLEIALDDRRNEVRLTAQQLLAGLPESQLVRRCKERLMPLLECKKKFLGGVALTVTLPSACDKAALRDGIGLQTYAGLGEKAGWLLDLVRSVPPDHWSSTWSLEPAELFKLFGDHEFKQALTQGLIQSITRMAQYRPGDNATRWYGALLAALAREQSGIQAAQNVMSAFGQLPAASQYAILQDWLAAFGQNWDANNPAIDWFQLAAGVATVPWPLEISKNVIARIQAGMAASPGMHWRLRSALTSFAAILDAGTTDYAEHNWPPVDWPHWPQWRKPIDDLLETLRFRHAMQRSFLETSA